MPVRLPAHAPVLIVGGGPIGLTASVLLSHFGVESVLVNDRPTTSTHPRARFLDVRTSEILDQIGLYDPVEATGLSREWLDSVRYSTTFDAPEVLRLPTRSYDNRPTDLSPVVPIMTSQDLVEPIMRQAAGSFDAASVRFGVALTALEQSDDGVRATLRDNESGREHVLRCDWVVGADGRGSAVRSMAGCGLDEGAVGRPVQDMLFHADLSRWVGDRTGALLFVFHDRGYGLFQPLDGSHRWRAQCTTFTPAVEPDDVTDELCVEWVRGAIGDRDHEAVIDVVSRSPWTPEERLATRFRNGRVLLAGDAAHTIFPTGGYGMNLGYHGVHNLAWKLAAVVHGRAGEELLDSYEVERRPQVALTLATATENARRAGAMYRAHFAGDRFDAAVERLRQYGNFDGMVLNAEYRSALCAVDPEPPPVVANPIHDHVPVVRSGRRAPHAPLAGGSTLDRLGRGYVLFVDTAAADRWASTCRGVAVEIVGLEEDTYALGRFRPDEAVLVRPDGVVADRFDVADPRAGAVRERLYAA